MKKLKIRTAIMAMILFTTFAGIGLIFILAGKSNKDLMTQSMTANMETYLTAQSQMVENFVESKETTLKMFGQSQIVRDILEGKKDGKQSN